MYNFINANCGSAAINVQKTSQYFPFSGKEILNSNTGQDVVVKEHFCILFLQAAAQTPNQSDAGPV